jgi:replicative DNA helicase
MTEEQAKDQLKEHLPEYLLEEHGIDVATSRKNFHCLAGTHPDNNPSMSYDPKRNKVHCFSCEADLDIVDLIKIDMNLDTASAFRYGYERYGIENPFQAKNNPLESTLRPLQRLSNDIRPEQLEAPLEANTGLMWDYYQECSKRLNLTDYPAQRGLSEELCNNFMIGYDPHYTENTGGTPWKALIIPTGPKTYIARNTDPEADSSNRYRKHGGSRLLNEEALDKSGKPIFIVEGEIDALSIIEAGGEAIGLGSTSNINKFLDILRKRQEQGQQTGSFFVPLLDNDESGRKATEHLQTGLESLSLPYFSTKLPDVCKDANDLLKADKKALEMFIKSVPQNREEAEERLKAEARAEYEKTSAGYDLDNFIQDISQEAKCFCTGFTFLDKQLDGGLFPGLYFIGAVSSLGKTTFALQVADQLAQQGHDVLIFSLEMSKNELRGKSLSRLTYLLDGDSDKSQAKSTRGILKYSNYESYTNAEMGLILEALKAYKKYAGNLYVHVGLGNIGTDDIEKVLNQHVTLTGRTPIVIIDYLQILAQQGQQSKTDKQKTDENVLALKVLSRDYNTPVLAISSFNRENYSNIVSMQSFKESGAIEYSSDVLIGLQHEGMNYREGESSNEYKARTHAEKEMIDLVKQRGGSLPIELKVLKNRNGLTGRSYFNFWPRYNYFENVEGQNLIDLTSSLRRSSGFYAGMEVLLTHSKNSEDKDQDGEDEAEGLEQITLGDGATIIG